MRDFQPLDPLNIPNKMQKETSKVPKMDVVWGPGHVYIHRHQSARNPRNVLPTKLWQKKRSITL